MQQYVFYNKNDGEIYYVKKLRLDRKADEMVTHNPSFPMAWKKLSDLTGELVSSKSQKLNLSTDPVSIVNKNYRLMTPFNEEIRQQRNARLLASDWTQGADSPLSDAKKAEWQTYRQALRDLNYSGLNHGDTVTWPTEPS